MELLRKVFAKIVITHTIAAELSMSVPEWIQITEPGNSLIQKVLELELDSGEASAFALYFDFKNAIIAIDDLKARKIALRLHIAFTGSFGIILAAKQSGIIVSVLPLIDKIKKTKFRFSEELIAELIKSAGEFIPKKTKKS